MAKSSKRKLQNAFSQMQPAKKSAPPARTQNKTSKPPLSPKKIQHPRTEKKAQSSPKKGLHPRNVHCGRYDFEKLINSTPALKPFVKPNPYGTLSIDFNDAKAVKMLNLALLRLHYNIEFWDIPDGYLCPPIPGRVDYIHYLADLLKAPHLKRDHQVRVLDIGTGANGIYPLVGINTYGWQFVASDIDQASLKNVAKLIDANTSLANNLQLRLQTDASKIFDGIIKESDRFDLTMCNPPFHSSLAEAHAGSKEKLKNLARNRAKKGHLTPSEKGGAVNLNFGGQKAELWCDGGEKTFLLKMIKESIVYANQCQWFTSLVSKKENLKPCYAALREAGAVTVKTIEMVQGNKVTRILAWAF